MRFPLTGVFFQPTQKRGAHIKVVAYHEREKGQAAQTATSRGTISFLGAGVATQKEFETQVERQW